MNIFELEDKISCAFGKVIELELRLNGVYNGKRNMDLEEINTMREAATRAKDLLAQVVLDLDTRSR